MSPPRGFKHSKKSLKKMSESHKKNPVKHWLGKSFSTKHRQKLSKSHLGRKKSLKWRQKIAKAHLGRKRKPFSEKWKKRIGEACKGEKHYLWGKSVPLKTREKIRKTLTGRKLSDEHKKNILLGLQKRWLSKKPTSIEKKVYDELKRRGILFEKQKLINGKFLVDAYIPSLNLIIEADGDYWHNLDVNKRKDKAENAYLKKCGFNLLRFSETEINSNIELLIDKLR